MPWQFLWREVRIGDDRGCAATECRQVLVDRSISELMIGGIHNVAAVAVKLVVSAAADEPVGEHAARHGVVSVLAEELDAARLTREEHVVALVGAADRPVATAGERPAQLDRALRGIWSCRQGAVGHEQRDDSDGDDHPH